MTDSTTMIRVGRRGGALHIELPGLAAVRIDPQTRVIAVDGISGEGAGEDLEPEWRIFDLRHGTYGDFHRLAPQETCLDRDCVGGGEHDPVFVEAVRY